MSSPERFRAVRSALILASALLLFAIGDPVKLPAQAAHQGVQALVTSTDPGLRLNGFARHQAMAQASPFKDMKWQWIGPRNISGRTVDIAVVAPRGKHYTIYAATATGGLWKTDNEATTWLPVFD